jgi:K+-sensing histidine kinase KdpD
MRKNKFHHFIVALVSSCLALALLNSSCIGNAPTHQVRLVDSLNQRAYYYRYRNPDLGYRSALLAYRSADLYLLGRAGACNNLGFVEFQRMNYERAFHYYKQVYDLTQNELELAIADMGMMAICQRTSLNKDFYDYRNSAVKRMKRIDENESLYIEKTERQRFNFAHTEFYLISAIYYYYLQQQDQVVISINHINKDELVGDTAQTLYYHYIKGMADVVDSTEEEQNVVNRFDELYSCWKQSCNGYAYFTAMSLQQIGNLLNDGENMRIIRQYRPLSIESLGNVKEPSYVFNMMRQSLTIFRNLHDYYYLAGSYVGIGEYLNNCRKYSEAMDSLKRGLDYISMQHRICYPNAGNQWLRPFNDTDTIYTEIEWITKDKVKTAPEWIARIREQLSVSYAGLNDKAPSNYNRNIFLDLMDYTRQDKELESRSKELEHEDTLLNAISLSVLVALLMLVALFLFLNKSSKIKNGIYMARLQETLDICRLITSSVTADAENTQDVINAVMKAILPNMSKLVGVKEMELITEENKSMIGYPSDRIEDIFEIYQVDNKTKIGQWILIHEKIFTKDDLAMINVITPYIGWTLTTGLIFISLGDERRQLEKQRYVVEQHIEENKRSNLIKKSCLAIIYGITPYIDRIINEVHKLIRQESVKNKEIKQGKYQYINELVTKINEYNDILSLWIKMKRGSLSLNIENFALNELFEVIAKGRKTFEMRHKSLSVLPTDAWVKADRPLTLFMINTLTENARKYTQDGGKVEVKAEVTDEYIEISVTDNGRGMTQEDVEKILGEKVYDSSSIGMTGKGVEEIKKNKGYGFGLMNCKGIIDKYRKTNTLFSVCKFSIDSEPDKGSRFWFRLPVGVKRTLMIAFVLLGITSCTVDRPAKTANTTKRRPNTYLLQRASNMADTAYYCNVMEKYQLALTYSDSAIANLNAFYKQQTHKPKFFMTLTGHGSTAEISWWNAYVESDYYVILDIRNEAAVSFLALKDWQNYYYNNTAYMQLYKLVSEDYSLENYCRNLKKSTNNKIVGVILLIFILAICFAVYYLVYIRKRVVNRLNLEQVIEINRQVLLASDGSDKALIGKLFEAINELFPIDAIALAITDPEISNSLSFSFIPEYMPWNKSMRTLMQKSYESGTSQISTDERQTALPLVARMGGMSRCVGVLAIMGEKKKDAESYDLLMALITRYLGIVLFNRVVVMADKYRDIELAKDETRRASHEEEIIHVQNMVLDNCLSTIKHETIYYPNRIKQIVDRLNKEVLDTKTEHEQIQNMHELVDYYKGIFTILSSCAARQLEEVTFRRGIFTTNSLIAYAEKYFKRVTRKSKETITLSVQTPDITVVGDEIQLRYLIENLIDEAVAYKQSGTLEFIGIEEPEYMRFLFTDHRRQKSQEELNQLFYPDLKSMTVDMDGTLHGTEYLVCKQIIRDHDEFSGHRGCRINAEICTKGGFTVYFTILKHHNRQ